MINFLFLKSTNSFCVTCQLLQEGYASLSGGPNDIRPY